MADITSPQTPSARVYGEINTGSNFTRNFEDQAGLPGDGSNPLLRTYSPFVIRMIPPAILGSHIASGGLDDPYSRRNFEVIGRDNAESFSSTVQIAEGRSYGEIDTHVITSGGTVRTPEDGTVESQSVASLTPLEFIEEYSGGRTGGFLDLRHQGTSDEYYHQGQDIYVEPGTPCFAPFAGEVVRKGDVYSDPEDDGGLNVSIKSSETGIIAKIMHLRNVVVSRGDIVEAGDPIGVSYTSDRPGDIFPGRTASHVHVEFRYEDYDRNGEADPYAAFDVSRIFFPQGYPPQNPVNNVAPVPVFVPGQAGPGKEVAPPESDLSQASQIGYYAAASNTLDNLDNFLSFQDQLVQGLIGAVTTEQIQTLQSYVRGDGEIVTPGEDQSPSTPAIMDLRVTADILLQIINMIRVPPIQLLINPQSLQIQYTKIQAFQERTRTGYVFQQWGEEQPTMSLSGRIGGYVAGNGLRLGIETPEGSSGGRRVEVNQPESGNVGARNAVASGTQFAAKHDSASFQQFMSLLAFYQSNGYIFDTIFQTKAHHMIGTIALDYDGFTYIGHFTNFSYSYTEEQQNGGLEFDMNFKISRIYDHSVNTDDIQPLDDPNGFTNTTSSGRTPGSGRLGQGSQPLLQGAANFFTPTNPFSFNPPVETDTGEETGESGFVETPPTPVFTEDTPPAAEEEDVPQASFTFSNVFGFR